MVSFERKRMQFENYYSLRPKMIVLIYDLGKIKAHSPLSESCKYDTQNRKQQLLQNTLGSCGVKSLLDDDFDSRKYLTSSL